MYGRYPALVRELTSRLADSLTTDPSFACTLLKTTIEELESDEYLMETLFQALLKRNRVNNSHLAGHLLAACKNSDPAIIRREFLEWEARGAGLRTLLEEAFLLTQNIFPAQDSDSSLGPVDSEQSKI